MKKFFSILRFRIINSFAYRGDILLFSLSGIAHPLIMLAIWLAVIGSGGNTPLSQQEFIQYYVFLLLVKIWTGAWGAPFIASDIRLGRLSEFLIRPAPQFFFTLGNNIGEKIIKMLYVGPVFFGLMFLFHQQIPALSFLTWLAFFTSLIGAIILSFVADLCVGFVTFWLEDSEAVEDAHDFLLHIFSGQLIPIYAFPLVLQYISVFLPFRYMLSLPLEILLQRLSSQELLIGMSIQLFWVGLGVWLSQTLWKLGLHRYSAVGA